MSDPDRLRYLTADGEVLYGTDADENSVTLARRDLTRTVTVPSDDPMLWEAPDCTMAVHEYEARGDCPACDGSGVDERIPPHLVGIGSTVHDAYGSGLYMVAGSNHHGSWVLRPVLDGGEVRGVHLAVPADLHRYWQVVRAVPPMREEDDR